MAGHGRSAGIYYTYSGGLQCCFNISTCCKKVGHSTCHNCQALWQTLRHDIARIYIGNNRLNIYLPRLTLGGELYAHYPGADDSVMTTVPP